MSSVVDINSKRQNLNPHLVILTDYPNSLAAGFLREFQSYGIRGVIGALVHLRDLIENPRPAHSDRFNAAVWHDYNELLPLEESSIKWWDENELKF